MGIRCDIHLDMYNQSIVKPTRFSMNNQIFPIQSNTFILPSVDDLKQEYLRINYSKSGTGTEEEKEKEEEKELANIKYNPFDLCNCQIYNPTIPTIYSGNDPNISVKHDRRVVGLYRVFNTITETVEPLPTQIHVKFSPLLDPIHYMSGKYERANQTMLPKRTALGYISTHEKINSAMNSAYVDALFCYISGQLRTTENMLHGIEFFGTFTAIQDRFKYNIIDEYDDLYKNSYFIKNLNAKKFEEEYGDEDSNSKDDNDNDNDNDDNDNDDEQTVWTDCTDNEVMAAPEEATHMAFYEDGYSSDSTTCSTECGVPIFSINTAIELEVDDEVDDVYSSNNNMNVNVNDDDDGDDDDVNVSSSNDDVNDVDEVDIDVEMDDLCAEGNNHYIKSNNSVRGGGGSDNDEEQCDGDEMNIFIRNFPVQAIFMERCEETLDHLLSSTTLSEKELQSMLIQVAMTLALYQHRFQFTHNDLHSNNVMWVHTDRKYIDYQFRGKYYRVPTFGKIYKIIDFGRSIYTVNGNLFCSDGFAAYGDAYTQYNCPPFLDTTRKEVLMPNYSFDLCFLGCSLFGMVFPDRCPGAWMYSDASIADLTESQKTVLRWCKDDNGKNVELTQTGQVRYPGFKLYKMIARTVHHHIPADEIEHHMTFAQEYLVDSATHDAILVC
jgi:hypothetical protein